MSGVVHASLLLCLLFGSGQPVTAVDAEREFADLAQRDGQWTAFRAFAAPDALLFVPEPVRASDFLAARPDPAASVIWWPSQSWVSCDRSLAVNSGPWIRDGGRRTGTFTTVWQRHADGSWRWLLDHGRETPAAVAAGDRPLIHRASCLRAENAEGSARRPAARVDDETFFQLDGRMPSSRLAAPIPENGERIAGGASDDRTLIWEARRLNGGAGAHDFSLWQWDGRAHRLRLYEVSGVDAED
jgi:hypothetical protein